MPRVRESFAFADQTIVAVISAHQDVYSRFISGSGASYWVLLALGLNPRRIHQTESALVQGCWAAEG